MLKKINDDITHTQKFVLRDRHLHVFLRHIVDPRKWRVTFRSSAAIGVVLVSQLVIAPASWAAENYWNGNGSLPFTGSCRGQFAHFLCWSGLSIPSASDDVFYTSSEPSARRTVDFNGGTFTNRTVKVTGAGYTWDLAGGQYNLSSLDVDSTNASLAMHGGAVDTLEFSTGVSGTGTTTVYNGGEISSVFDTYVGNSSGSNGTLNVTAGGTVDTNNAGLIAAFSGSRGSVTVGGSSALWDVANDLQVGGSRVGSGGTGILRVNTGGTVNAVRLEVWNGNSEVTTGGAGQINVNGLLRLRGGGKATSGVGVLDDVASGFSSSIEARTAIITGAGSRWDTNDFYTGRSGTGTTTVSNGGVISSVFDTYVGNSNGSNGMLNITSGGTVDTNNDGLIGFYAGSTGSVTVGGSGAFWDVADDLRVGGKNGSGGTGTLTVNNGGRVSVGDQATVWQNGTLDVAAGHVFVLGGLVNEGCSQVLAISWPM